MNYTSSFAVLDASEAVMQVQEETGVQIHGVLGTQFLVENKWIVNFDKLLIMTSACNPVRIKQND